MTSLLEAKRHGLSRSALRSHQPVARPITAGLSRYPFSSPPMLCCHIMLLRPSIWYMCDLWLPWCCRRGPSLPQVAALAPVPDLLGSILSGQSMLLMDSSDVVINRDGSLKATKPGGLLGFLPFFSSIPCPFSFFLLFFCFPYLIPGYSRTSEHLI